MDLVRHVEADQLAKVEKKVDYESKNGNDPESDRSKDLPGVLGRRLNLVHGLVSVGNQGVGISFVRRTKSHPQAPSDDNGTIIDLEGLGEDVDDPASDLIKQRVGNIHKDEAEFVSPQTSQSV